MPITTTITCALSGVQTAPDESHGIEDFNLPAGWIEITIRRVEPNPDYLPALQGAATLLHQQQYGKAKKSDTVPSVEDVMAQIQAHPDQFTALQLPDELVLNEWEEYLAPEAAEVLLGEMAKVGLDLTELGVAGGAE